jgi:hypothetical protein
MVFIARVRCRREYYGSPYGLRSRVFSTHQEQPESTHYAIFETREFSMLRVCTLFYDLI